MEDVNQKAKGYSDVLNIGRNQEQLLTHLNFRPHPKTTQGIPASPSDKSNSVDQTKGINSFQIHESPFNKTASLKDEDQILIINGIQDITNALLEDSYRLDDIINMVVETNYRGLGFTRALVLIKDPKENTMNGRFGLGQHIDEIIRKFKFKIENPPDVFNMALMDAKDFFIENTEDPVVKRSIPDWYRGLLKADAFVLFPITINKNNIGLIYADVKGSDRHIATLQLGYMKNLRNQIVLAIRQKSNRPS